jgi:hypothetical protein
MSIRETPQSSTFLLKMCLSYMTSHDFIIVCLYSSLMLQPIYFFDSSNLRTILLRDTIRDRVCVCEDIDNKRSQQRLSHVNAIQRPGVQGTQLNSETGGCTMTLLALPCSGTAAQWPRFSRRVVDCDLSFPACRMPYACSLLRIRESWTTHDMHNMARCMSTETFFGRSVSCYRLLTTWYL